ncbi:porin [Thalassomonas actiniarum]|uniref:Porin n=1 Tax=Thalassomonas actiniarum TaxID=485447 RepID=A0AAF0C3U4_9GAMM|nr:porin [Thalassomonas actiniarum]WDE01572.1 porin [Thalassomonas actiniarum]
MNIHITVLALRPKVAIWLIFACLLSLQLAAEPYFAVREGLKCSACHTNITGGGQRTDFGFVYPQTLLPGGKSTFSPKLNEHLLIGGNIRSRYGYTRFDEADAVEGASTEPVDFDNTSSFEVTNGTLYIGAQFTPDLLFYLDQQVAPEGGRTREAAVIWKNLSGGSYIKAGKFFLPYGLRLEDDGAFIREVTGFNFDNSDIGLEVGIEPGDFSFSLGVTNGTQGSGENNKDKQLSFVGSYIQRSYRLGVSYSTNEAPNRQKSTSYNIFAGVNWQDFTLLGEVDWIENENGDQQTDMIATLFEVNYLLNKKTNLKFTYEYLDPDDDIDENERVRGSVVGEYFLNRFSQLRTGIRIYDAIPQNSLWNQDRFFLELHLFY